MLQSGQEVRKLKTRISALRKHIGLTQEEFATRLGLSRNYIWMVEKGDRIPSDRTIADICREFGVREEWLRTGEGEMLEEHSGQKKIAAFLGDLMREEADGDFRAQLIGVLADLTAEEWALLEQIARRITGG